MSENLTYEQLMASFDKLREQQEETARRDEERKAEHDAMWRAMKESARETERVVKRVSKQLGYMSYRNGAAAENYFYNSFKKSKEFGNEKFDYARKNIRYGVKDLQDEYDIVLYNGQSIGIIEVKYTAEKGDVAQTLKKVTTFRQLFPEYKDFTFYLGLASFVFTEEVEKAALNAGLAVIKQVGKTMVVQDERMKKF